MNHYKITAWSIVIICFSFFGKINAQTESASFEILFKKEIVVLEENFKSLKGDVLFGKEEVTEGKYFRLIQFYEIPNSTIQREMKKLGIVLLEYLPNKAYFASLPADLDFYAFKKLPIRSISKIKSNWKTTNQFQNKDFGAWAFDGKNISLSVFYFKNISKDFVKKTFEKNGFQVLNASKHFPILKIKTPIHSVDLIAAFPFVSFVGQISEPGKPEGDPSRHLHRSNILDADFPTGRHYDGTGIRVMVRDDGAVGPHIDFQGRLTQGTNYGGGHGDAVAGMVGAAGNLDPTQRGAAKGAEIYVRDYQSDFLDGIIDLHQNENVLLTNSSYSDGCNNGYNDNASTVDFQVFENPTLMHVFSAGNAGESDCNYGAGANWGNITGGHKIGKNVFTIGNVQSDGTLESKSSHGPTTDGRIKPDLCANGVMTTTTANNQYTSTNGTSFAAPAVMGVMAQLYQAHQELQGEIPTSALIKSIMLNTATDIENEGPDFRSGWGVVNAHRAVRCLEDERYLEDEIEQGEINSHNMTLPNDVRQLKVMLYWADEEGIPNVAKALVNDLDLNLTAPGGAVYLPWILDESPDPIALSLPATQGEDHLNNMEQVVINNPVAGVYNFNVEGFEIPFGNVKYYISYEIVTDEMTLIFPNGGEGLVPNEIVKIHWEAYDQSNNYLLEYSSDEGNTWNNIASIDGGIRSYDWEIPNLATGKAQVRISNNNTSDISDANFSISSIPTNLEVEQVCYNSIRLVWEDLPTANFYEVFTLGEKYMESIGTTSELFFETSIADPTADNWFAIRALGDDEMVSRRTLAILYNNDILNCPTESDLVAEEIIAPVAGVVTLCDDYVETVIFKIANAGITTLSDFEMSYQLNDEPVVTELYSGFLGSSFIFSYIFNTPLTISSSGNYTLKMWVNDFTDPAKYNDSLSVDFEVIISPPAVLDIFEDFESTVFPPTNWGVDNLDNGITWAEKIVIGSDGNMTNTAWIDNFNYNGNGAEDELITMTLDLSDIPIPGLSFDLAYVPYSQFNFDSMRVDVYTDCGNEYVETIYGASGVDLASLPTTNTSDWQPANATDWKNEIISLANFSDQVITLKFINVNGFGNNLYLDNINIFNSTAPPIVDFNSSVLTVCINDTITFYNNTITNSAANYLWDFGTSAMPYNSSTEEGPHDIVFSNVGTQSVSLEVTNAYGTDFISKEVLVVDEPSAAFDFTAVDGVLNFQNLSQNGTSYFWDFGDGMTSEEEHPVHTFIENGTYTITLTVISETCNSNVIYSEEVVVIATNVEDLKEKMEVSIFPNPNDGLFYLRIESEGVENFEIELLDVNGRLLDQFSVKEKNEEYIQLVDYQYFITGIYLIKIKSEQGIMIKKMIVQ
ncbi:MAG: S8 family serine peptidase [Saprospiraceae bacterium]